MHYPSECKGDCSDCADCMTTCNTGRCIGCFGTADHPHFTPKEEPTMRDSIGNIFRAGDILVSSECPNTDSEILCKKIVREDYENRHKSVANFHRISPNYSGTGEINLNQASLDTSHWVLKEPTMSHTPDPPTTSQILSAAEDCPDARRALKRLYPKVFDKSIELAQHSTIKRRSPYDSDVNGGISMVWVSGSGNQIVLHHDFNWERSSGGKILTPTRK